MISYFPSNLKYIEQLVYVKVQTIFGYLKLNVKLLIPAGYDDKHTINTTIIELNYNSAYSCKHLTSVCQPLNPVKPLSQRSWWFFTPERYRNSFPTYISDTHVNAAIV